MVLNEGKSGHEHPVDVTDIAMDRQNGRVLVGANCLGSCARKVTLSFNSLEELS